MLNWPMLLLITGRLVQIGKTRQVVGTDENVGISQRRQIFRCQDSKHNFVSILRVLRHQLFVGDVIIRFHNCEAPYGFLVGYPNFGALGWRGGGGREAKKSRLQKSYAREKASLLCC